MALHIVSAAMVVIACHDTPLCYEGDWRSCRCEDGRAGFAACDAEGETFGDCACEGTPGLAPPPEPAAGGGGAGGGSDLLPLYAPCTDDAACESALCYGFNAKGPRCTLPCEDATDCPAPSSGCNNKGVCKPD